MPTAISLLRLLRSAANGYMENDSLSRGAAIAYYSVFSLAPLLVIVIAVAGLAFGDAAARGALVKQLGGVIGTQGAEAIQGMIENAARQGSGLAAAVGIATLLLTATGVFSEMRTALNNVWKAQPQGGTIGTLIRVRLIGLALVIGLGFLLVLSLVIGTALSALGGYISDVLPGAKLLLYGLNVSVTLLFTAIMLGALYKVLPETDVAWRDVAVGAVVTAMLFAIGRFGISSYIATSTTASTFGAAGALAVILLWIYYSSQIFLFGAEFTRAYSELHGTRRDREAARQSDFGHAAELATLKAELARATPSGLATPMGGDESGSGDPARV